MAEWSKAPDSRLILPNQWDFWSPNGGVGSNPTPDTSNMLLKKAYASMLSSLSTITICSFLRVKALVLIPLVSEMLDYIADVYSVLEKGTFFGRLSRRKISGQDGLRV